MHTLFAFLYLGELQSRGGFPLWQALPLGILAVVAIGVLYVMEAGRLGVLPRVMMALVRAAIVALVAILLVRPAWVREESGQKPRPVAVLIDVSQSMDKDDPRPNDDDKGRVAIAFNQFEPNKGLPDAAFISSLGEQLKSQPKRMEVAVAALTNPKIDFFNRLAKIGPLQVYTFGTHRTEHPAANTDWLKSLKADESRTAMVEAAFELLNRDDNEAPAAIVIVTDGRENGSGKRGLPDLERECARRKIPIHVYGVGSSEFGQLQAAFGAAAADKAGGARVGADVEVPSTLFVDDTAAIPVHYTIKGVASGIATVVLKYGDREVATKKAPFALTKEEMLDGKTFAQLMQFVPNKTDAVSKKQEYSATVTIAAGGGAKSEPLTRNVTPHPAQVLDRKLKILWVDSKPRFDFQFLQREVGKDRHIDARFFLTDGDRLAMRSGPPWMVDFSRDVNGVLSLNREDFRTILLGFDLLILGDVPGKFFTLEHQQVIKEFVTEGGGFIQIAGRWHAPAEFAPEKGAAGNGDMHPIADMLPVEFNVERFPIQQLESPVGFVPVLAPAAARTQIVSLEDDQFDNAELWGKPGPPSPIPNEKQLKPMYWHYPVTKVKPAADVFLTHPTERTPAPDNKPMPLLVGHHFGKGYVLFVGFDDTWRWRFNTQSKLMGRFWMQAIYTAGIPRIVGTSRTQVSTSAPNPIVGTSGEIFVKALNENFQPIIVDEIEGDLEQTDAKPDQKDRKTTITFKKVSGSDGEFVATLPFNREGQFKLTVDARNKSPATLYFPVRRDDKDELASGPLDEAAMRKLCSATGGETYKESDPSFYREETLIKLPEKVKPQATNFSRRDEILLWNRWAMIALIGLLTVEWVLRKFNGLS